MATMQISQIEAYQFAVLFLEQVTGGVYPDGFPDLHLCTCGFPPVIVRDIDGSDLFYDFPLVQTHVVGTIRIAATKLLGHPFISIHERPTILATDDVNNAINSVFENTGASAHILSTNLVCYSYPNTGYLVTYRDAEQQIIRVIVDTMLPQNIPTEIPEGGITDYEGGAPYSILGVIPSEVNSQLVLMFDTVRAMSNDFVGALPSPNPLFVSRPEIRSIFEEFVLPLELANLSTEKLIDGVQSEPQIASDYCVIACIDMMARFFAVLPPTDQNVIEQRLANPPALYTPGGIRPSDQVKAFRRIFDTAAFNVSLDTDPTWAKAITEINIGNPFKSGIFTHARVACGYKETTLPPNLDGVAQTNRYLWINDPTNGHMLELQEVLTKNTNTGNTFTAVQEPKKMNMVTIQHIA